MGYENRKWPLSFTGEGASNKTNKPSSNGLQKRFDYVNAGPRLIIASDCAGGTKRAFCRYTRRCVVSEWLSMLSTLVNTPLQFKDWSKAKWRNNYRSLPCSKDKKEERKRAPALCRRTFRGPDFDAAHNCFSWLATRCRWRRRAKQNDGGWNVLTDIDILANINSAGRSKQ